jgi:hypothetical protein
MTIQTTGEEDLRDAFASLLDKGQFGTSATVVTTSDDGVLSPVAETLTTLESVTTAGKQVKAKHSIPTTLGNSNTLAEHEIVLTTGNALTRNLMNPLNKTNKITVEFFTIFTMNP